MYFLTYAEIWACNIIFTFRICSFVGGWRSVEGKIETNMKQQFREFFLQIKVSQYDNDFLCEENNYNDNET